MSRSKPIGDPRYTRGILDPGVVSLNNLYVSLFFHPPQIIRLIPKRLLNLFSRCLLCLFDKTVSEDVFSSTNDLYL